jgi:nucleoside-diphosphate-sugar epimerase
MKERVLVTGATGFLGKHTALRLLRDGYEVTGLGRNLNIGRNLEKAGVKFVAADLAEGYLDDIFQGHDYVIHCAALSSPWGRYQEFYDANVRATVQVIEASREAGVKRMVHVSTPSLYIDSTHKLDISVDEPLPKNAINFYADTKRLAEDKVTDAVSDGFSAIIIRPQGIIGPGDSAILPRLLRMARKKVLPIIGEGDNLVDLTYVDNVVEALVLAMRAPEEFVGRKYNITNGEPIRLYDMLERIFTDLGFAYRKKQISFEKAYFIAGAMEFGCRNFLPSTEPLLTRYSVCALGLSRTLNIEAARRDLNYEPIVNMKNAIKLVTEAFAAENSHGH